MSLPLRSIRILFAILFFCAYMQAQVSSLTSGEITVQLKQGLDSSTDPNGMSDGRVTKSTNPAVPVGSSAMMGISIDGANGGFIVKLLKLGINGQNLAASSSDVVPAPDFFNRTQEKLRAQGQPQDTVKGHRIFLPERMIVRFTLATPSTSTVQADAAPRSARTQPSVITPTSPSIGPVGGPTFNPQTAPNLQIAAVSVLASVCNGKSSTVRQAGLEAGLSTFNARENVIVGGVIQPPSPGFFHGVRGTRLNPGTVVQILDVRAMDDGEHDILHILVQEDFPAFTNVAFVFPKGDLGKLSEPALEGIVAPFFSIPPHAAIKQTAIAPSANQTGDANAQNLYVVEGVGLRMSLDQVRAAAKIAGSLKGPIKQGPTTYNLRTNDLSFQIELDQNAMVYQYNVSALNPRHVRETEKSGPLYDHLIQAFGPASSWGKPIIYDLGEGGGAYAIISDPVHFQ